MPARLIDKLDVPPDVVRLCEDTVEGRYHDTILGWAADEPYYAVHVLQISTLAGCAVLVVRKDGDADPQVVPNHDRSPDQSRLYERLFHGVRV